MAPPNRGSSKANNTSRFTSTSSSTVSSSSAAAAFARSATPSNNSSLYINDSTSNSSSSTSSFPSLTIPYSSYQDQSQQNIFAYNPPAADSTYPGVFGNNSNSNSSSLDFGGSTFSSPASPSPQYLADPSSTLGPLFQSDINPGLMSGFEESYTMYTDPAPPSSRKSSAYSTSTSSSSRHGSTDLNPFPSYGTGPQGGYPGLSLATRGHSKLSGGGGYLSDQDMDTDQPPPLSAGSGYVYNFSEIPGSPQDPDELEDDLDASSLAVPSSNKGNNNSYLKSSNSSAYYAPSSKEKEQNKQKLYRNRKSEFTNRMRDELLAMNLLPHSRVTHAPEIMSKTADTLRDYRELLIMIKDSVDGMPENLASVPGAVRKMLNEKGQMFNAPQPTQPQRRGYSTTSSSGTTTKMGHVSVPNSAAMPIGYGAQATMQRGF